MSRGRFKPVPWDGAVSLDLRKQYDGVAISVLDLSVLDLLISTSVSKIIVHCPGGGTTKRKCGVPLCTSILLAKLYKNEGRGWIGK